MTEIDLKSYPLQEIEKATLEYFNGDKLATDVWIKKYCLKDEKNYYELTPDDMHHRLAKEIARIEKNYPNSRSEEEIYESLKHFKRIVPQGSPMSGIGNNFQVTSIGNCFVIGNNYDSYGSIFKTDQEQIQLMKRRGGCGHDLSHIRPDNSPVKNDALSSTGIVPFMERYSNSTKEVAQCLHESTLILTKTGLKLIKDIHKGDYVWTENGWVIVLDIIQNKKKTYKIKTKFGNEIITSKDHIFTSFKNEKKVSEFNPGDEIDMIFGKGFDNKEYLPLIEPDMEDSGSRLIFHELPKLLNEDVAYLLGFMYGNGCMHKTISKTTGTHIGTKISLSCALDRPEIIKKLKTTWNKLFESNLIEKKCDGEWMCLEISSQQIYKFLVLNEIAKEKAGNLIFPDKILKSPSSVQLSFISGYFDADGYASDKKKGYVFSSIDKNFLLNIKYILSSLGILTKLHEEDRSEKKWQTLYSLCVIGAFSKSNLKNRLTESLKLEKASLSANRDCFLSIYKAKDLFNQIYSKYSYIPDDTQYLSTNVLRKAYIDDLEMKILNPVLYQDYIKCVDEFEEESDVYDLILSDTHLFWANGFYTHNSNRRGALLMSISIKHPDSEAFIDAKLKEGKVTGANISVKLDDEFMNAVFEDKSYMLQFPIDSKEPKVSKEISARKLWNKIIHNAWASAEPGVLFWDTLTKESISSCYGKEWKEISTNPCVVGDTLVSIADGRNSVTIKQLAEEGNDIPVYCLDNDNNIVIRTMRNPRITGYNQQIYKITIEGDHILRVTGNHKLRLDNGQYIEAKDLKSGDSLHIATNFKDITSNTSVNLNSQINEIDLNINDIDPEIYKIYKKALDNGYDAEIIDNKVLVTKVCEECGSKFKIDYLNREVSFCSTKCAFKHIINNVSEKTSEIKGESIKIKSIELDGFEDVYNGTVDDFHNFYMGCFKENNENEYLSINSLQCGELPLPPYDSCRLLCLNLFGYVKNPFTSEAEFDWTLFKNDVILAQRYMDDIVDLEIEKIDGILSKIESDPEPDNIKETEKQLWINIKNKAVLGRRSGLGITGEGDMLASLNLRYGTDEATKFAVEVHNVLKLNAYKSSVIMAKERGMFPMFDHKLEINNPFLNRIKEEDIQLYNEMCKYGRRNLSLLTIAPTGSVSICTQTTSGIEPVFLVMYMRRRKINPQEKDCRIDFVDDEGVAWMEYPVFHHKFEMWLKINGYDIDVVKSMNKEQLNEIIKKSPYYKATSNDIDWIKKVEMQGLIQKEIDHSISVTVNIPKETTEETVSKIYESGWKCGCKGITVYRDGSRTGVLVSVNDKKTDKNDESFHETHAPKRPKRLKGEIHRFQNNLEKWIAVVGIKDGRPYEIFTGKLENGLSKLPPNVKDCEIIKNIIETTDEFGNPVRKKRYDIEYIDSDGEKHTHTGLNQAFNPEFWNYAKLISGILRHGMPIVYVYELIDSLNFKEENINTWKNGVVRTIKKYIKDGEKVKGTCPNCGSEHLEFKEGCLTCMGCGYSKCS